MSASAETLAKSIAGSNLAVALSACSGGKKDQEVVIEDDYGSTNKLIYVDLIDLGETEFRF